MAKRKIKSDGENKKQVKFGLNHGITKVWKASTIIKSNLQPNPTMATEPPRATCSQFLDGDSATSLGSLFQCLTTLSMKKFSLVSKYPRAPHYCQISLVIHALVWRERGALQGQWFGAGRSWEQRHKISALSLWRMECGGLRPFPRRPPVPRSAPAARDRDPASRTSRGNRGTNAQVSTGTEEPPACLLTLRNPTQNQTLNPIP